jgi:hypothetical protein
LPRKMTVAPALTKPQCAVHTVEQTGGNVPRIL